MGKLWDGVLGLVVKKLVSFVIILLLVLTVEFLFFRVGLGEDYYIPKASGAQYAEDVRAELHLDKPLLIQYFYFIGDMLTGKGSFEVMSLVSHFHVGDAITSHLPWSVVLFELSLALSLLLGASLAILLSRIRREGTRAGISLIPLVVWSVPVVLMTTFLLIQVVMRYGVEWAYGLPSGDYDSMGWFDKFKEILRLETIPILSLTLCTFCGFALIALRGITRAKNNGVVPRISGGPQKTSFSGAITSVLPSIKLNLALLMSFAVFIGGFWMLPGLGLLMSQAYYNGDVVMVDASIFVTVVIVLINSFAVDMAFSLLAFRSAKAQNQQNALSTQKVPATSSIPSIDGLSVRRLWSYFRWFISQYVRSPMGIAGAMLLIAMAVLAITGPMIGKPFTFSLWEPDPVDQFLIGARDPFVETLSVVLLSSIVGFGGSLLVLPFGRYSYPVALLAECFVVFPIIGIAAMIWYVSYPVSRGHLIWTYVLSTVLVTWAPVALTVLRHAKDSNDSFSVSNPGVRGSRRYMGCLFLGFKRSLPDALAAVKFVAVVGTLSILLFRYMFFRSTNEPSWPGMIYHTLQNAKFEEFNLWWILPLVGVVLLIASFYMVLDASQRILEKRIYPVKMPEVIPSPSFQQAGDNSVPQS